MSRIAHTHTEQDPFTFAIISMEIVRQAKETKTLKGHCQGKGGIHTHNQSARQPVKVLLRSGVSADTMDLARMPSNSSFE